MEKILYVTEQIPTNAKILLVDVDAHYFEDTDYEEDPKIQQQVGKRVATMSDAVEGLIDKGHEVYAIIDYETNGEIFHDLKGLPHTILPFWGSDARMTNSLDPAEMYVLDPRIIQAFNKDDVIVVAGLWRELCAFSVARLLTSNGFNAVLSLDDRICFKNEVIWSQAYDYVPTLEKECGKAGVGIEQYEEMGLLIK